MANQLYHFVPYENKIPCGGFSALGGGRKWENINR